MLLTIHPISTPLQFTKLLKLQTYILAVPDTNIGFWYEWSVWRGIGYSLSCLLFVIIA